MINEDPLPPAADERFASLTGASVDEGPTVVASPGRSRKSATDWESVERRYRAGLLSVREIAKQAGVSEGAVRKKVKANGWERDLTAKVRDKVRTELVRSEYAQKATTTERELVETAAATIVQVVREHRKDIAKARRVVEKLLDQLDVEVELKLPAMAATLRDVTTAMKTLIALEREAFSVDEPTPPAEGSSAAEARLSALLSKISGDAPAAA